MFWIDTKEHGRIEADSYANLLAKTAMLVIKYGDVNIICGIVGNTDPIRFGLDLDKSVRAAR